MMRRFILMLAALAAIAWAPARGLAQDPWFEIDSLNPGLPPPAETVNRRTAYSAMETFIDSVEAGRSMDAAHVLNLADVPEERQATVGPELANRLGRLMDRNVLIPWRRLLDRPDNLDARASGDSATAGSARQSILISYVDGPRREVEIRLNRVKPPNGDPVWVFSRETVNRIDTLYAIHGPTRLERMLPEHLRREAIWGLAWWELIALPLLLALAALAGWSSYRMFEWRSRKADGGWQTAALHALRWPSVIAVVTSVVWIATGSLVVFSGPISAVMNPLIVIGYVLAFMLFALQMIDTAMRRFVTFDMGELSEHGRDDSRTLATAMSAARRVLVILATVVSVGIVLSAAQLSSRLGLSLLASAGALTLILGFAARRVLGNILASMQIMLNRSARIGDQINFEGQWCTVERIHFTFVQLKVWNGDRLVVPVERFVSDSFLSYTLAQTSQVRTIRITLAHSADLDAVREAFNAIVRDHDGVSDPDNAQMKMVDQDAFGPVARFQIPVENPDVGWAAECEVREALLSKLQQMDRDADHPILPRATFDDVTG
ncbi:mechanosensitive ion channel family protein [Oceaniglobus indicus]|uniref:mechanosensitive ion channel family protein n=1 Tax=Oceaniglobus indicus TaxID=2047749 RepID=UPI000C18021F|nr:mechanosensitive ion channel family protein [Oceaniglobus indicus]